jgi:hypothetical protein
MQFFNHFHLDQLFILCSSCSPTPQVNLGAGPSHPIPAASASSLPPTVVAFEESAANQAAEVSQVGSESAVEDDAVDHDAVFGHEDA